MNLTPGRHSRNLAPHEVQFVEDLSEVFAGLIGLAQRQPFEAEVIEHASQ